MNMREKLLEADAAIVAVYREIVHADKTVANGMRIGMLSAALASIRSVIDSGTTNGPKEVP